MKEACNLKSYLESLGDFKKEELFLSTEIINPILKKIFFPFFLFTSHVRLLSLIQINNPGKIFFLFPKVYLMHLLILI